MHSYGSIGGQIASSSGTSGVGAAGGAGVSKEVLRGLQDVVWSDDEVRAGSFFKLLMGIRTSSMLGQEVESVWVRELDGI